MKKIKVRLVINDGGIVRIVSDAESLLPETTVTK